MSQPNYPKEQDGEESPDIISGEISVAEAEAISAAADGVEIDDMLNDVLGISKRSSNIGQVINPVEFADLEVEVDLDSTAALPFEIRLLAQSPLLQKRWSDDSRAAEKEGLSLNFKSWFDANYPKRQKFFPGQ